MYLRKLKNEDAEKMLEWMHDENVVKDMAADFMHMNKDDCLAFIEKANKDETKDLHRAICSDEDGYLGTISLKNISFDDFNAEYAIVLSSNAIGRGIASESTKEILRIAFKELELHKVYLYVKASNLRARRFYEKIGFREEGCFVDHIKGKDNKYDTLHWMAMLDKEFDEMGIENE